MVKQYIWYLQIVIICIVIIHYTFVYYVYSNVMFRVQRYVKQNWSLFAQQTALTLLLLLLLLLFLPLRFNKRFYKCLL